MGDYDIIKMQKKLQKYLDEERFHHTLGVMYTCAALAMTYGYDIEKAQLAGLLHDSAKCIPNKKKLKLCREYEVAVTEFEEKNPFLLHAKLGAVIARTKYKVEDPEILEAICCHTTGKPEMNTLDKILYIADYIEPMRSKAPNLQEVRKLAFQDLDECIYKILKDTLDYLESTPKELDEMTRVAYAFYKEVHDERF